MSLATQCHYFAHTFEVPEKKKYGLSLEKDQTLFLYEISFLATQTIFFLEYFSPQTFSGSEGHFLHIMVP